MNNKTFVRKLNKLEACTEAVDWVKTHGGTASECWQNCEHGDWMAWLAAKTPSITRRQLVGALAECAELSLKYYEKVYPNDKRVRECLGVCRAYSRGEATDKELASASAAAHASAAAYASAASAAAAHASAAAYASAAAAYAASRTKTIKKCADIFRKHFPDLFKEKE